MFELVAADTQYNYSVFEVMPTSVPWSTDLFTQNPSDYARFCLDLRVHSDTLEVTDLGLHFALSGASCDGTELSKIE